MQIPLILISALTPVVVLLWYIYRKDKVRPEPAKCLLKAFGFGVLSAFLSFVFSVPVSFLLGMEIDANTYSSISKAFADAFILAAIPEELAKLIMCYGYCFGRIHILMNDLTVSSMLSVLAWDSLELKM